MEPSVARQNAVEGMHGFSPIRSWYVLIMDVTLVSGIVPLLFLRVCFEHNTALDKIRQYSVPNVMHY